MTNPKTGEVTTVSALVRDPAGTPTAGDTAFVQTSDGYYFLVKAKNEYFYNDDATIKFQVTSINTTTHEVTFKSVTPGKTGTWTLPSGMNTTVYNQNFNPGGSDGMVTPDVEQTGVDGRKLIKKGQAGYNGHDGALFVPPANGGDGAAGPDVNVTNGDTIYATAKSGIEEGSIGGDGGKGGDAILSFWTGADGGVGGAGGPVTVTNNTGIQVATTGNRNYGIFAYSRSGAAGAGGSSYAGMGGGTGGDSSNGGDVMVTNNGNISTSGNSAHGIYGLSVGNSGGYGGDTWGIGGVSGSGGLGGSGGTVTITNGATGTITTSGAGAHGILAQSIGGVGGDSGTSGNLIVSLQGTSDNGGHGGDVTVTNNGSITTTGPRSRGIFAQSVGGGGGSGGMSGGLVALGGSGSNGGNAGTVTVKNNAGGVISTSGVDSDGIFAQSIGGSGGSSSNTYGLVSLGGGGTGTKAGDGGEVLVENYGTITTTQNKSRGIVAQSIGGGGGDGGTSQGMVSVGGSGSGGGSGARVTVTHGGEIRTQGNDSSGIFAESVGGGGGNGGSAGSVSAFVGVAIGGTGGSGGDGGVVDVTLQGKNADEASIIHTEGNRSIGLFAQSVGGGGGNGGGSVSAAVGTGAAVAIAIGGDGGGGGDGGDVTLSKGSGMSIIETEGVDAAGVLLQSVGGGGGNGGYSISMSAQAGSLAGGSFSAAIGGNGGGGGDGGNVTVGNYDDNISGFNGAITTGGANSTGFLAQSVGGGGGNGGLAVAAAADFSLAAGAAIAVGVGGDGGSGGNGGAVDVVTQGNITTQGKNSTGLLVQSVGGGGGNGGGSVSAAIAGSAGVSGSVGVGLGGSGGTASDGGVVRVRTSSGTITTTGENSAGIIAQSIGGGGGNAGYSVAATLAGGGGGGLGVSVGIGGDAGGGGNGGAVTADFDSNVVTKKDNSAGIIAQSIGGGGGNGGYNVSAALGAGGLGAGGISVGLGGKGGAGGAADTVNASYYGVIDTSGDNSIGFLAQAVGGGGGNGGFNVSASGGGAGIGSGAISVGLGGSGLGGGAGGDVTATITRGTITTRGDNSAAIVAQSIGGGGGNGGFSVVPTGAGAGVGAGAVSVGLGGSAADGGDGKSVTLDADIYTNHVTTTGKNSAGVIAQSIGGGGGNGGYNVSAALGGAGIGAGGITVGLGGTGGKGGAAGTVNASYYGVIDTSGDNSIGFLAQAIGGGGGNGGFNVSGAAAGAGVGSGAVSVGLGGSGSGGGAGGDVTATIKRGTITTGGDNSAAIVAQSIGGGGGNGGFNVSAALAGAGVGSGSVSVGLGGSAAGGGDGKSVTFHADKYSNRYVNNVTTTGDNSAGVIAQSIGGGGGNGGYNVSAALGVGGIGSGGISAGLGGTGGAGGTAGTVNASYSGGINTSGDNSIGFLAQAVGGGGGNGGFNVTASGGAAGEGAGAISFGLGGSGSGGGNGGVVTASTEEGTITTKGDNSAAIVAQSIGGGGGNGGFNVSGALSGAGTGSGAVSVGLGGSSDKGGNGQSVTLTVDNQVDTTGDNSAGIIAQSIGGGGGNGGFNVSGTISGAGTGSGAVSFGLGGSGSGGGSGGQVTATTSGDVLTRGENSQGIIAQSIGGGGGNGGFNVSGALSGAGTGSGAVSVGLGGSAGGGSSASTVTLTVNNHVETPDADYLYYVKTFGDNSDAVVAQSIGGGGGNGGFNVSGTISGAGTGSGAVSVGLGGSGGSGGSAGTVTSTMTGDILTRGENSRGFVAQSIGGGGGNGGFNVSGALSGAGTGSGSASVGIGGSGGTGGAAGEVHSELTGNVTTLGDDSIGVVAQSIGGGGGNGAFNVSGVINVAKTGGAGASVGIGGSGGSGGTAKAVTNKVAGNVTTGDERLGTGNNSTGVLAQSVGGGGGNGGFNISGSITAASTGSAGVSVGIGGSGGFGGSAGTVDNTVEGNVTTFGNDASGVIAQSLGGGGGNGALSVAGAVNLSRSEGGSVGVGIGGSGGSGGTANTVTNKVTGNVITGNERLGTGNNSTGVLAQSVGGGGGNGGTSIAGALNISGKNGAAIGVGVGGTGGSGGTAGSVVNTVHGNVTTWGVNGDGIIAQSIGGGGGNGGVNVTGAMSISKDTGGSIGVGIGGSGGAAGNAGTVFNTVHGDVYTHSSDATGILAQSVGGGGGNGGTNVTGNVTLSGKSGGSIGVGIGGAGEGGGAGMRVDNYVTGNVHTLGENSAGIIAQSLGGGGGVGATNVTGALAIASENAGTIGVGVGGTGGGGGDAGTVFNQVDGVVTTAQKGSIGILAQSAGGGGGNGGLNVIGSIVASVGKDGATAGSLNVGIGGMGGGAGKGGEVTNNVTGAVATSGDDSTAILGQSLGGGGGNGGLNVTGSLMASLKGNGGSAGVGIGGFGGGGGDAGMVDSTVTVDDDKIISTAGDRSMGVVAQSLAGGGGNGGLNVTGQINYSDDAGGNLGFGLGGFGGSGGNSGIVNLDFTGNVLTAGSNSHGVVAQSLAGGGGNGGINVTGGVSFSSSKSSSVASIGIGGFGGGGGNADDVNLQFQGQINNPWLNGEPDPTATGSHGILAQSLGGGGGNGGLNVSGGFSYSNSKDGKGNALLVGVGGFGGDGGNAGNVDVTVTGGKSITAHGDEASAIFAQSLGGGGGNGGLNVSGGFTSSSPVVVGIGGFGGNGGTAGNVTVVANADLYANGAKVQNSDPKWIDNLIGKIDEYDEKYGLHLIPTSDAPNSVGRSTGITAQSIGGGGGNGGLNISGGARFNSKDTASSVVFGVGGFGGEGAVSGEVEVDHTGSIQTTGDWGHGILAQSIAGGGGNGGLNVTANANWTKKPENSSQDFSVIGGIGGFGGEGADAKKVEVTSVGNITTDGAHSRGILAQSIGGGGGTGGFNVTSNITQGTSPVTIGIGGFGSGGGNAGDVVITRGTRTEAAGKITTAGTSAHGIEASSIGGGGGDAGGNFSFTYGSAGTGANTKKDNKSERTVPKHTGVDDSVLKNYNAVLDELEGRSPAKEQDTAKKSYSMQLMLGGAGGEAGNGASVTVNHFGDIETLYSMSYGILAQSIGGGGGNASLNKAMNGAKNIDKSLDIVIGGATGDGGIGGDVFVEHLGSVITRGSDSTGILAQSIGGGGGNVGSDSVSTDNANGNVSIAIGRKGGTGGEGGNVTVITGGSIETYGGNSHGVQAQSVGNGGGNSSSTYFSGSWPGETDDEVGGTATLYVGLEGGIGGFGGDVDVTANGYITTHAENSHAIFAQSVGGGGGNGGDVYLGAMKEKKKVKDKEYGLAVGGSGGTGGYGGLVTVENNAILSTTGKGSIGILAQSVGGGGGTGGEAKTQGNLQYNGNVFVSVGGGGGIGAAGGDVDVTNDGIIVTRGVGAHGVLAQSVGGGGGQAGMIIDKLYNSGSNSDTNFTVQVGGSGGDSNSSAGAVTINNTGGVETFEAGSVGLFGQSVGGGGGNATLVTHTMEDSASVTTSNDNYALAVGGKGGTGGVGGNVTINNTDDGSLYSGVIVTHGQASHGIAAMSIGGGGGTGGGVSSTVSSGTTRSLSIGGEGGEGGTGGAVAVNNTGTIVTFGDKAHGILAQSVGGGGGNASDVLTINTNQTEGQFFQGIAVGGKGGSGNYSGDVTVTNSGEITTLGEASYGILAQSVGGGGGNGSIAINGSASSLGAGSVLNSLSMGGFAGTGADSGDVSVEHTGTITIQGDNSYGIYAQSVGGGGGSFGASLGGLASSLVSTGLQLAVGAVQSQGSAGKVTVDVTGDIFVTGNNSHAVFQQSVNGGGGDVDVFMDLTKSVAASPKDIAGAPANLPIIAQDSTTANDLAIALGGQDVVDGYSGGLEYNQHGTIVNFGDSSTGSSMQSVGGGGGQSYVKLAHYENQQVNASSTLGGSYSINSAGGDIIGQRTGDIIIVGNGGVASIEQSIGGGGGISSLVFDALEVPGLRDLAAPASVGMQADGPVTEGTASVTSSSGAVGGGVSTLALEAREVPGTHSTADPTLRDLAAPASVGIPADGPVTEGIISVTTSLGAVGGSGNNGGNVSSTVSGNIITVGDRTLGILRQSIGAGGGLQQLSGADEVFTTIGGTGGAQGDGRSVSLHNVGSVQTDGVMAHGIVLQSIGGGGGLQLSDTAPEAVQFSLNNDNRGNGGAILLNQTGNVVVTGDRSIGVLAQSLGGGGGAIDRVFMDTAGGAGSSGNIDLTLDGSIIASGAEGIAVFAQSRGADGQGDINLNLTAGHWLYAGNGGIGIMISGGHNNSITNSGLIFTADGIDSGFAIFANGSDGARLGETNNVLNYGTIIGNIDLGAGNNTFNNQQNAALITGTTFDLGTGTLTNNGWLSAGGYGNVYTTEITGNLVQSSSGIFALDLDTTTGMADYLNVSGTADLAGVVDVNLLNPARVVPGTHLNTIVKAADGATDSGLSLTYKPSIIIDYALLYPNETDVVLSTNVDFSPGNKLGHNQKEVGDAINAIQLAGGADSFDPYVLELLDMTELGELAAAYDDMTPATYDYLSSITIDMTSQYTQTLVKRMHSLRSFIGSVNSDMNYSQTKDYGFWVEGFGQWGNQDSHRSTIGYESDTKGMAFGLDRLLDDNVLAGISVGTSSADMRLNQNQGTGDIRSNFGSAYGSYFTDRMYVDGVLSYGRQDYHNMRSTSIGSISNNVSSSHDGKSYGAYVESGYMLKAGAWALQPFVSLGYTYLDDEGYKEHGAEGINLIIEDRNTDSLISDLGARIVYPFKIQSWLCIPEATLAWQHDFDIDKRSIVAAFGSAPNIKFSTSRVGYDTEGLILGAAVTLLSRYDISFSINYTGDIRTNYNAHSLSGGIRYEF